MSLQVLHLRTLALRVAIDNPSNEHVLSDLEATYKWLNTQVRDAGNIMIQHHAQPLFLNVDDPLHDVWTWHCADELFFNISDSRGLYAVRKFLEPFKDLLRVSGVEEILNPPCPETQVSSADMQLTSLRLAFDSMRQERTLTDVIFLALNGDEFPAHRSLLVSTSEYFRDLFCGSFREAGPASAENPVEVSVNHSSLCLKSTLGEPLPFLFLRLTINTRYRLHLRWQDARRRNTRTNRTYRIHIPCNLLGNHGIQRSDPSQDHQQKVNQSVHA